MELESALGACGGALQICYSFKDPTGRKHGNCFPAIFANL